MSFQDPPDCCYIVYFVSTLPSPGKTPCLSVADQVIRVIVSAVDGVP